jgi:hypothetical protein
LTFKSYEEILGLDIPVNDVLTMDKLNSLETRDTHLQNSGQREFTLANVEKVF